MSVNFGNLDYFGHVPADELKDTIRLIAYEGIRSALEQCSETTYDNFQDYIDGIVYMTEALCTQIDEEVADKRTEVDRIMKEYQEREAHKNEKD